MNGLIHVVSGVRQTKVYIVAAIVVVVVAVSL